VNVLLDTVALYRATVTPESLPRAVQELLLNESNALFVSLVSAWELAIKSSLGKLPLPCPIGELFPQAARDLLAQQLEIDLNAVARVAELPPLHRDPFDRLIIAQALLHECTVVTSDTQFAAYGVNVIW